jgi:hypothetical protein
MFGTLFKFGADTSQFSKAVMTMPRDVARARNMINGQVQGMNTAFSALGRRLVALTATFGGMYAVVNSFKNALDMSGRLNDMSQATGETAGNLAILERAFANSGVGAERAGQTIAKVQKFVGDLGRGGINAGMAARALGITFDQLKEKTPLEQMQMLANGLSKVQDAGTAADLSMLIFGTRTGGKMTALLKNFGTEINNARSELGSLPEILNKNAEALDQLGDKLTNSIGNKLNEFAVGALAGAQGANDLADALSRVDAAGAGLTVGNLTRFAATNPLKALEALGNTLLSVGADIANEIAAQVMAAFQGLVNVIVSGDFWVGVGNAVQGALLRAATAFQFAIVDAIATALEAASRIPVAGAMFEGLGDAARKEANMAADAYRAAGEQMRRGMSQAGDAFNKAGTGVYERRDLFGEDYYARRAVANFEGAQGADADPAAAAGSKTQSAQTASLSPVQVEQRMSEIYKIYNEQLDILDKLSIPQDEFVKRLRLLNQQMNEAQADLRNRKPQANFQNDAMTEPERQRAEAADRASSPVAGGEATKMATETTLQKVAAFLEELTGKLPQPVLA